MRRFVWAALLSASLGCEAAKAPPVSPPPPSPTPTPSASPRDVPVVVGDPHGGVLLPPDPPPEIAPRARRRMDLDQLDRAIRQVTGGIGWTELRGNVEVNLFTELSATLGKPDFVQRTEEDLTPSAMFQKFLDDAARSSCQALMRADPDRMTAERTFFVAAQPEDTLATKPQAVEANLRALLLTFHGRTIGPGDPALDPWTWFFRRAEHTGVSAAGAWRAVCVALITHPDFYLY